MAAAGRARSERSVVERARRRILRERERARESLTDLSVCLPMSTSTLGFPLLRHQEKKTQKKERRCLKRGYLDRLFLSAHLQPPLAFSRPLSIFLSLLARIDANPNRGDGRASPERESGETKSTPASFRSSLLFVVKRKKSAPGSDVVDVPGRPLRRPLQAPQAPQARQALSDACICHFEGGRGRPGQQRRIKGGSKNVPFFFRRARYHCFSPFFAFNAFRISVIFEHACAF